MAEEKKQNLFYYCQHNQGEVLAAFSRLVSEKDRLMGTGVTAIPKMYEYIDLIAATVNERLSADPFSAFDMAAIAFFDSSLINSFITNPEDKQIRDTLTDQILLVAAATGNVSDLDPYDLDELDEIGRGAADYYEDVTFAYTLSQIMLENEPQDYIPFIIRQLQPASPRNEWHEEYSWIGAFLRALIIRVAWFLFPLASQQDQFFLVENYLYSGTIVGTPINTILKFYLSAKVPPADRSRIHARLVEAINENQETIILQTSTGEGKSLNDIFQSFLATRTGTGDKGAFAQEIFFNSLYNLQEGRDKYIEWLREMLMTVLHVRNLDWDH